MSGTHQHRQHEAGMVSILVTMILLIVISLIVLGFAQISRRNQRQTLDRQLSSQAFYAAETGVNDVRNLINQALASGATIPAKTDCTNGSGPAASFYSAGLNPTLSGVDNVSYSCVMVDPSPTSLAYSDIGTTGTVAPMTSADGNNFSSITLTWQSKTGSATPTVGCPSSATGVFSPTPSWTCGYGVLRLDLVPVPAAGMTTASLQNSTFTTFMVPVTAGTSTVSYASSTAGNNLIATHCTNTQCSMTINGLSGTRYYMRLLSQYKDVSLQISAKDSVGTAIKIQGSQAVIDATGKAQDILRRIQVRLPLTASSTNLMSDYAVETTDAICKRFVATDGYFQSYASSAVPGLTSITAPPNPLCQ
jgi:Tfp pilus assembly protein PilX